MVNALGVFLLNLAITAGAYLCVPVIIALSKKKFTASQIKRIVIWNGAIVWIVFAVIRAENGIDGSGFSVFLWSAIAHLILKEYNIKSENKKPLKSNVLDNHGFSLSAQDEVSRQKSNHRATYGKDIGYNPDEIHVGKDARISEASLADDPMKAGHNDISANMQKKVFCKKCGKQINDEYIYCPYCGKRIVKKNTGVWKTILVIAVMVLVVSMMVLTVSKYLYNKEQLMYYNDAVSAMDAGDFIVAQRNLANIDDYENRYPEESAYIKAGVLMESGEYIEALSAFEKTGLSIPARIKNTLYGGIYVEARSCYRSGLYSKAEMWFEKIESYRDTVKYLTLISAREEDSDLKYEMLMDILSFEDAKEIVLESKRFSLKFLEGKWKTSDGKKYFEMDEETSTSTNLPQTASGEYYTLQNGVYRIEKKDGSLVKCFEFEIVDEDAIEIFCFKDNVTYKMYRQ